MKKYFLIAFLLLLSINSYATFTVIQNGDPGDADVIMQNFRNVNYGNPLLPVNSVGAGINDTIDLGSSSYYFKDGYISRLNISSNLNAPGTSDIANLNISSSFKVSCPANIQILGINNSSPLARLHVGSGTSTVGASPSIYICETLSGDGNSHGVEDQNTFSKNSGTAYASFDARPIIGADSSNYDHYIAYQASASTGLSYTGTLTRMYGFGSLMGVATGNTVDSYFGFYSENPTGTGIITDAFGLWIGDINRGSRYNFAVYATGGQNYLGGNLGVGVLPESNTQIKLSHTGLLGWDNGSGTTDCGIYRSSAHVLKTDDSLVILGALSKGSGSFDIPHIVKSKKNNGIRLRHYFVETPSAGGCIYKYQIDCVTGNNDIKMPDYFDQLNDNVLVWVSPVKHFGIGYGEYSRGITTVSANKSGKYNVFIFGDRKDEVAMSDYNKYGIEYKKLDNGEIEIISK